MADDNRIDVGQQTVEYDDSDETASECYVYQEDPTDSKSDDEDGLPSKTSEAALADSYFPKDLGDINAALRILTKWVPSELGLRILHEAKYWIRYRVAIRKHCATSEHSRGRPVSAYITSGPIAARNLRVREIKIDIWSHDQGWSDYPEDQGTYRGSWTWFELGILRPQGREEISTNIGRLVTNIHASSATMHHQVVFQRDDDQSWVRHLRAGDQIFVTPRARFPGWTNYTRGAAIEVYTNPF